MKNLDIDDPFIHHLLEETYTISGSTETKSENSNLRNYFELQNEVAESNDKNAFFEHGLFKRDLLFLNMHFNSDISCYRVSIAGYLIDFPYSWSSFGKIHRFHKMGGNGFFRVSTENDKDHLIDVLKPFCPYECDIGLLCLNSKTYLVFLPLNNKAILGWIESFLEL